MASLVIPSLGSRFSFFSLKRQLLDAFVFIHSITIKDRIEWTKRISFLLINHSVNRIEYPLILTAGCKYKLCCVKSASSHFHGSKIS